MDTDNESVYNNDEDEEKCDIRNVPKRIIKEFIETYRAHPALWQVKNTELYKNRNLKTKGYGTLIKVWKKYDPEANMKMVKSKVQSLRGSFRKELRKMEKSQRSGSGTDEVYRSHLWYFNLMRFLIDDETSTNSSSNIDSKPVVIAPENHDFGLEDHEKRTKEVMDNEAAPWYSNTIPISVNHVPQKRARSGEEQEQRQSVAKFTEVTNAKLSESEAFGQYISMKLEKIKNPEQRMYAESLLTKVLNKAIMNKLTEDTHLVDATSLVSTSYSISGS